MSGDFDTAVPRLGTASLKWDGREARFGRDVLPMWVADMDFAAPPCVVQAIQARAAHPIYGYPWFEREVREAAAAWFGHWHGWKTDPADILVLRGAVPGLYAAVQAFAREGEGVLVMPPVYPPFFGAVEESGRRLLLAPLHREEGEYRMDWERLEALMPEARLLLLCSPHNPVGRVWRQEELRRLGELAQRHEVPIVSDEVHADLAYDGHPHTPMGSIPGIGERVITLFSAGKSFNIAGLELAVAVIPDAGLRERFSPQLRRCQLQGANLFALVAARAAWTEGAPWLRSLRDHLEATAAWLDVRVAELLPGVGYRRPEFGYLAWLDFRALGLDDPALWEWAVQRAKVGLNPGPSFGVGGEGFLRLNFGAPRSLIEEGLNRLAAALPHAGER